MNFEPIYTIADLKNCKPSDLLEKAVAAYPDMKYEWMRGAYVNFQEGECCPAAMLFGAAGLDYSGSESFPCMSPALQEAGGYGSLGQCISRITNRDKNSGAFQRAIDALRELGC